MHDRSTRREFLKHSTLTGAGLLAVGAQVGDSHGSPSEAETAKADGKRIFRAGAAIVDISPQKLPVVSSGGFLERMGHKVNDPLHARGLVLDDGSTPVAICVVDNLMISRKTLDRAKSAVARSTGIPTERMLISATHTHSAPSVLGALGTGVDEEYTEFLHGRIVECIEKAAANLAPARVGWASIVDSEDTNCRVWIKRPDRIDVDPFGERTIRAMMHPGYQNPDYIGPCGPEDPMLTVLSVQSPEGVPTALLANYSMHYFGAAPISADYFGPFAEKIKQKIGAEENDPPFVGVMSHGTSGDQHWMDYSQPQKQINMDTYADRVATAAMEAYKTIEYRDWVPVAMAERKLTLDRRLPNADRLAWAEEKIAAMGERTTAKDIPEVYALEQIYLRDDPVRELKLQALRIGELGITAIPCEVYAISGLKLKAQSPLELTMNVELANGGEGYIPPPELHPFGGYNTWPARSAGLERQAEPKIVETLLELLEEVSGKPRRQMRPGESPYAECVSAAKPTAYWRMGNIAGQTAEDVSGGGHHGRYEDLVAFYLEGPEAPGLRGESQAARAAHFAGGRLVAPMENLGDSYSVQMWFWNGLPNDLRAVTGYIFSRSPDGVRGVPGDNLGIGGTHLDGVARGKLFFFNGDQQDQVVAGTTDIEPKTWNQVVLTRDGQKVAAYLNGNPTPELSGTAAVTVPKGCSDVFIGGRGDNLYNFHGKICEAAVYDRPLSPDEISGHYNAAAVTRVES